MPANSQSVEHAVDRLTNTLVATLAKLQTAMVDAAGGGRVAVQAIIDSQESLAESYGELTAERDNLQQQCDELTTQAELLQEQRDELQARLDDIAESSKLRAGTSVALSPDVDVYVEGIGGRDDAFALFVKRGGGWLTVEESKSPELVVRRNTGEVPIAIFAGDLAPEIRDILQPICQALTSFGEN